MSDAVPAAERSADEETRAIAAMTFDAMPVDPTAFTAANMAKRAAEEGVLLRTVQIVMAEDDVGLTAWVADVLREPAAEGEPDGLDAVREIIQAFAAHAAFLRDGAQVFESAKARLGVALHRAALQLEEDAAGAPESPAA